MAELLQITQPIDVGQLRMPAGESKISVTATSPGLEDSVASIEVTYSQDYLEFRAQPDNTYAISKVKDSWASSLKDKHIIIPSKYNGLTVTGILESAFAGHQMSGVEIPPSITHIDDKAFQGCTNLKTVTFEESSYHTVYFRNNRGWSDVRYYTQLGNGLPAETGAFPGAPMEIAGNDEECAIYVAKVNKAFMKMPVEVLKFSGINSNGVREETEPIGITVAYNAFDGKGFYNTACWEMAGDTGRDIKLYEYNAPSLTLGKGVFMSSGIETIAMPNTIRSISEEAFSGSQNLQSVTFSEYSPLKRIGNKAFDECSNLIDFDLPDTVMFIGNNAFIGCSSLTSIIIRDDIREIGAGAFSACDSLEYVIIGGYNNVSIGDNAFSYCTHLANVVFKHPNYSGDSLTTEGSSNIVSIGARAFYDSHLSNITIPASVTRIGKEAFNSISMASFSDKYGWFKVAGETPEFVAENYFGVPHRTDMMGIAAELTQANAEYALYKIDQMIAPEVTLDGATLTITDKTGLAEKFSIYVRSVGEDEATLCATVNAQTGGITLV